MKAKKIVLFGLSAVCVLYSNPAYANENINQDNISEYEIIPKTFDTDIVFGSLFDGINPSEDSIQEVNGNLIIQAGESEAYIGAGHLDYSQSTSCSDIETLIFYYILPGLIPYDFNPEDSVEQISSREDIRNIKEQIENICEFTEDEELHLVQSGCFSKSELQSVETGLANYGEQWDNINVWDAEEYVGLEYEVLKSGIPVMGENEPTQGYFLDIAGARPVYIQVLVGNGRILCLTIENLYETLKTESTTIISKEDALEIARSEMDEVISDNTIDIEDIKLEYVPIPDWTSSPPQPKKLLPYWCITRSINDGSNMYTDAVRINAVTGGNLAYGE